MLIEDALFTLLSQDAGITGFVGDRIYPVRMPQLEKETTTPTTPTAVSYPALLYTLVERPRSDTHDGPDGLVKSFFLLECIGKRYTAEVKQLANKVRLALNGNAALLASIYGGHVKRIALQDERDTWGYDDVEQREVYDTEMDFVIYQDPTELMAASALTVNEFSAGEVVDALVAANADGNTLPNYTGKEWFELKNDDATASTATFNSQVPSNYGTDVNLAVEVDAAERKKVKLPPPASRWRDANGAVQITYDKVTDLTAGAFRWPE